MNENKYKPNQNNLNTYFFHLGKTMTSFNCIINTNHQSRKYSFVISIIKNMFSMSMRSQIIT